MQVINSFMRWGEKFRGAVFSSVFKALTFLKITANHITFLRLLGGISFVFIFPANRTLGAGIILAATILDWFDGGLARYQKRESDRGKFWDVMVDHLNYVLPIFTLLLLREFNAANIGYHLLIVPVLYLLATIKESEHSKTDWIIRPYYTIIYFKPIAIAALIIWVFFSFNYVEEVVFGLNIAMTSWAVYYTVALMKRWHK